MVTQHIIVNKGQDFEENPSPILKTKKQWRKERYRLVVKGATPVDYFDKKYMAWEKTEEIATDGTVTVSKRPVAKVRRIPVYSIDQTQPCKRVSATLLRDVYCQYFVDDAERQSYGWWSKEKGHWVYCRAYLNDEMVRLHIKGDEVYGVLGGEWTCFSAIDADYHGGDHAVFKDQVALILNSLHGKDGWHYSISPRGVHIIRTHGKMPTSHARADLRQLLVEIDGQDPELHQRAVAAEMKPISDWEIYPDPKQAFRLPLARGRVTLLEKPHETVSVRKYVDWQTEPTYCSVEDAVQAIFNVILPIDAPPPKERKGNQSAATPPKPAPERVFGNLRGRYAQVLVDFWTGVNNPPDSLNAAVLLTARMMPYYFSTQQDAVDFIEELIDGLPDVSFCDRLATGKRNEVSSEVRRAVTIAYEGNCHQQNAALSRSKLDAVFTAWKRKSFSLIDRSTWGRCSRRMVFSANDVSWSSEDIPALTYFARLLHIDLSTAADATRRLLQKLSVHPTGEMTVEYVRKHLLDFGVKCKSHHGKVNEYLNALAQAGWIEQVGSYVVGYRGRQWRIGERMTHKFVPNPSTNTTNPLPHLYLYPLSDSEAVNNVLDDPENDLLDGDVCFVGGTLMAETAIWGQEGSEHAT